MRLGIPNRGRLHTQSVELVRSLIGLKEFSPRKLYYETENDDLQVICIRSTDIPKLLVDGVIDLGITGNDYIIEAEVQEEVIEVVDLEICPGELVALVLKDDPAQQLEDLPKDVKIFSQYPISAKALLSPLFPNLNCKTIDGAAEVYPNLGLCRAVVDIIASGETAKANRLRVLCKFGYTSARLYRRKDIPPDMLSYISDFATQLKLTSEKLYSGG